MKKLGLEERKFITLQLRTNTAKLPGVDDTRTPKLNPLNTESVSLNGEANRRPVTS